ncbi:autotransporter outer membrane beta-barrel domain-containing protein [Megasphaera stantonii]|uniref:autotransporter outer membrane beta-barrel domain-containing protein n=1 Tax=Megasphaera stantonii TaxID=2144175 RepID=UPI0023F18698|nr:autotransporter outer membrane beta-barrel domain-containing protein [Megasphaera stantonii]
MIGKRNLGKAVVLGLLLSTGMYGAAWAAEEVRGGLWTDANYTTQEGNDLKIVADGKDGHENIGIGYDGTVNVLGDKLTVESVSNAIQSGYIENAKVQILANNIEINAGDNGIFTSTEGGYKSTVIIGSEDRKIESLTINAGGQGIDNKKGNVYIYGTDDSQFYIHSLNTSGKNSNQAAINNSAYKGEISMTGGSIRLQTDKVDKGYGDGITNSTGTTTLNFNSIEMDVTGNGICNTSSGTVYLNTKGSNTITSAQQGIYAEEGTVDVTGEDNTIIAGDMVQYKENNIIYTYGKDLAIHAGSENSKGTTYAGTVNLTANNGDNDLFGAVYAIGNSTNVNIRNAEGAQSGVYSAAIINGAGDLQDEDKFEGKQVVSALYAEHGATINWSGKDNVFLSYAKNTDENTLERTVWAYDGATINIEGKTIISTNRYKTSPKNLDVAIAAGTGTNLLKEDIISPDNVGKSKVNIAYDEQSYITGDVLSAYTGNVTIAAKEGATNASMHITGNLLSGNNGIMTVDLGNGGTLSGRIDDYGDAGTEGLDSKHTTFFNPTFSSTIYQGGEVNLKMGEGSYWQVTGQSWVTSVDTGNSEHVEIDLVSANSNLNEKAQALTIGEMNGNAMFTMQLDGDRKVSDMLYMKKANGEYFINLKNAVTVEDMYNGFDGLRFATVGKGSHATFSAGTYGNGVYNVEYEVGTDDYATSKENNAYNSTNAGGEMDAAKPGNALVDNLFKDEPQGAAAYGVMTLAAVDSPEATDSSDTTEDMGTNTGMNGEVLSDTTNFKLIDVKSTELSNAGKTIIDMSKVNYANAIYMDRLNKRMGEARYIDGDEGLWVRIRHDRIGKSDAFRSKNTMMELGYDKRVDDREDGEHRRGFAIDYMRGTAEYHNVAGDGDVRRGGVWFYDTWLGNKGHYSDYVLKFGRLSNDFDIYSELGEKITGDYSNFVYSASAEYGRKKDIGKDWYFEPQVQLQYAHVTDADYTTSQGTSVELDAIDSLIGRVGFRLGKDMGENNTFYVKADVLHEFLGDQDISAFDATGRLDTTYENEGTWYDVGLGFSHQFSKGTYMFLDVEKTFGNDNEDTYQFNVGMNWKV